MNDARTGTDALFETLTEPFFTSPTFGAQSLQALKELGGKRDRFQRAFRAALEAADPDVLHRLPEDRIRTAAQDAQPYAWYMSPEQAGRFAADEVLRIIDGPADASPAQK